MLSGKEKICRYSYFKGFTKFKKAKPGEHSKIDDVKPEIQKVFFTY